MSIAKCADDYHIDCNKPATLSLHAMCSRTIPFNYLLKDLIMPFSAKGAGIMQLSLWQRRLKIVSRVTSPSAPRPPLRGISMSQF